MQVKHEQIEHLLTKFPQTRNSDRLLTIHYWLTYFPTRIMGDKKKSIYLRDIMELPSTDEISRHRRKIQETKLFPTDENVARRRHMNIDEWKIKMGYVGDTFNRELNILKHQTNE